MSKFARTVPQLLIIVLLASPLAAQQVTDLHEDITVAPAPAWVDFAEIPVGQPEVSGEDQDPITYLLVDDQVRIPASGPHTTYRCRAYRINSRSALEDWSSQEIEFDPAYQKLVVHQVMVYRDGEWVDRIRQSRWSLMQREEDLSRHVFDQRLTAIVFFDDVRVGDILCVASSISGANPVFDGRYAETFGLGWHLDVERRRVRILAHPNRRIAHKVHGTEDRSREQLADGWNETILDLEGPYANEKEDDQPYDWIRLPWVQFSEWGSWREVVDWAVPLYERAVQPASGLSAIAAGIRADAGDTAVAARNWVQDEIRYLAIVLDKHSHEPHGAAEVLGRRYGDCKDKAVLLISLLGELGHEAHPVLVNTQRYDAIRDWLPSPHAFNHVIVTVGQGEDRVWFDPTITFQGEGEADIFIPPFGLSLVIEDGEDGLTPIPASNSDPGTIQATYRYTISEGFGDSAVDIVTEYSGHEAEEMRDMLAGTTLEDLSGDYVDFYNFPGSVLAVRKPLAVTDDRSANILVTTERYTMSQEFDKGSGLFFETLSMLMDSALPLPDHDRVAPLALDHPYRTEEIIEITTTDAALLPINEQMDTRWFRYSAETKVTGDTMRVDYELETLVDRVAVEDLAEYEDAVTALQDSLGIVFSTDASDPEVRNHAVKMLLLCAVVILFTGIAALTARRRL